MCMCRSVEIAKYIIENKCTIRSAAKAFNISKSSVYKDVTKRLKNVDLNLYFRVKQIMEYNYLVKHIRGGESTRRKYLKL